ncbi:MAG: GntP family permease [Candidatus Hydrogenedentes bacterium]|nr:GntP family permease [Candidatus Hydrogenedentota bacterium]
MFGPIVCLAVGILLILVFILYLRLHPFLALATVAIAIAVLSDRIPTHEALPLVARSFGEMMGNIGILIALAAIIGKCLMDSGAADRIVRAFTRVFGPGRENYALLSSGFVLSIPVFFDTVFYLLAPLARAAYARSGRDYVLLICSVGAGAAITHALVPPTPGPLAVAEQLGVSVAMAILGGLLCSVPPAIVGGVIYAKWINRRMPVAPGAALGVSEADLSATAAKADHELPGLFLSMLPFALPIVLLAGTGIARPMTDNAATLAWLNVFGDKNLVFMLGAGVALWLVLRQRTAGLRETMVQLEPAVASGAVIAFITSAGGAFGKVLAAAGVGEAIGTAASQWGLSLLALAFLTAALVRIAQGSATVAMLTAAGIVAPALETVELSYHPVYLMTAIGLGATGFSWMNDSGFWLFGQLTGLSETQTLKTWSASLTIMALSGILWVALLTRILPLM